MPHNKVSLLLRGRSQRFRVLLMNQASRFKERQDVPAHEPEASQQQRERSLPEWRRHSFSLLTTDTTQMSAFPHENQADFSSDRL
jgi:hypothetical protein